MRDAASAKRQTSAAAMPLLPVLGLRTRLLFLLHVLCVVIAVTVSRVARSMHLWWSRLQGALQTFSPCWAVSSCSDQPRISVIYEKVEAISIICVLALEEVAVYSQKSSSHEG